MEKTLEFPELLRLIDERSTAFRAAVAAAPSLDVQVPTCPEWTLSAVATGEDPVAADASIRGAASELVPAMYGRIPLGSLELDGNRRVIDLLVDWDPDE